MSKIHLYILLLFILLAGSISSCNANYKEDNLNSKKLQTKKDSEMQYSGTVNAPDFHDGLEWLNTEQPLSIKDLKGKVVLLDFWTYCCINCIHVIPDLKKLEEEFAEELVVIGVHSAKFENEKVTDNIREAILRYEIEHPVVNDKDFKVWREYGVRAWPSFALINPRGKLLGVTSGEGVYIKLRDLIEDIITEFDEIGEIDRTPLNLVLEKSSKPKSLLSYPGKISFDSKRNILWISDSNHNRIIGTDENGKPIYIIGTGKIGFKDGSFAEAQFFRPQGVYYSETDDALYVADTENHAIRKIDLLKETVSTIAGTGDQGGWGEQGGDALTEELNSPWDLVQLGDKLIVAMAGPHQIWSIDLTKSTSGIYAGNGREDIIDGNLANSSFAQPSGIAYDGRNFYIADSEVSGIRMIDSKEGDVTSLVGQGLFEFGDVDGSFPRSRLQHAIGCTYHNGKVYIADTYNHKIKLLDPKTKRLSTLIGTGERGYKDGDFDESQLNEPNDVEVVGNLLYITDTNNDLIRVANLDTKQISTFKIDIIENMLPANGKLIEKKYIAQAIPNFSVKFGLPANMKFTEDAPALFRYSFDGSKWESAAELSDIKIDLSGRPKHLWLDYSIYYCEKGKEAKCYVAFDKKKLLLEYIESGKSGYEIELMAE